MKEYTGKINYSINFEKIVVKKHNSKNNLIDYKDKILYLEHSITTILNYYPYIKGIIIKEGTILSHVAIVSRELKIPSIINVEKDFEKELDNKLIVSIKDNKIMIINENI
jgi:phosphohistidine swiveling domain-containing protein